VVRDPATLRLEALAFELSEDFLQRVVEALDAEFEVHAFRRRSLRGSQVEEGLLLWTCGLTDEIGDYWEPVRRRGMVSAAWHETQTTDEAAAKIRETLEQLTGLTT
jgi:hypothetical protein